MCFITILKKVIEEPRDFLLIELYLSVFADFKSKIEKLKKIFIITFKNKRINPLHVNINNTFVKIIIFYKTST